MKNEILVIWKHPKTRQRFVVGTLREKDNIYKFKYIKDEIQDFDYYPGFEDRKKEYLSKNELFSNIANRLPNSTRSDYAKILEKYDLNENSSKMDILKKTKGRLLTDTFEFVEQFNQERVIFDIAGINYQNDFKKLKNKLKLHDEVNLVSEKKNKHDKYAIRVEFSSGTLGYVPKYYSKRLTGFLKKNNNYSAIIIKLNVDSKISDEYITIQVLKHKVNND